MKESKYKVYEDEHMKRAMHLGGKKIDIMIKISMLHLFFFVSKEMADWEILYYNAPFAGRAEFVRLIFEEAGVPYTEPMKTYEETRDTIMNNKLGGFPVMFPPVLKRGISAHRV